MDIRHLLEFDRLPSGWSLYPRIFASRKPTRLAEGVQVPRIEAVVRQCGVDPRRLERYRQLIGEPPADRLPIGFPHLIATPLQLAVLSAAAFPVRLMGLVHVHNVIVQYRPIHESDSFEMRCGVEGHRETTRGQEFDVETVLLANGYQIWHETSTFLSRRRPGARATRARRTAEPDPVRRFGSVKTSAIRADAGIGRSYAWLSGDYNPIHLSGVTARMFGFRGAIAHGMWSLARCAAEIGATAATGVLTLDVSFHSAIFLPAALTLQSTSFDGGKDFALLAGQGEKRHLTGTLRVTA